LAGAEPTARPPQGETSSPQAAPDPAREPPPFSSFFSSLTSGFTTASTGAPQPDTPARDARGAAVAQPDAAKGDDAASKRRQRADAKPAPVAKPDRQASARPASLDQTERDRLFQEFLRWRDRQ
jgi:hypothetical protein